MSDIRDSGLHLLSLITNILDLSKVEAGQLVMRAEKCDLIELSRSAIRLVDHLSYEQGVRVSFSSTEDSLPFQGDPRAIKQILVNLLSNALKFTQPPGRVTLQLGLEGEEASLLVIDEGIGMTEEEVEVALLPFRQVENPLNRRVEGSGLGLSLVKALAEAHGGSLHIESRQRLAHAQRSVCRPYRGSYRTEKMSHAAVRKASARSWTSGSRKGEEQWFVRSDRFDAEAAEALGPWHRCARRQIESWRTSAEGTLALVLLLTRCRHLHRGSAEARMRRASRADAAAIKASHRELTLPSAFPYLARA